MSIGEALLLALALCVDSFVVSTTVAFRHHISLRKGVVMAIVFALCQTLFPAAGALVGDVARGMIESVDHWVAFGLLALVGGKMIADGLKRKTDAGDGVESRPLTLHTMFLLGIATSIDSLAVGIGLGLDMPMGKVMRVVSVVGVATLIVSILGVVIGRMRVKVPERVASVVAGVVLVGLGIKILLEHLLHL